MVQKKVWIYGHYNTFSKETEYQLSVYERSEDCGDVLIAEKTVEFETLEEKEVRVKLAAALKSKLNVMRADHYKEQMELQESIGELLSLEFKPATEEPALAEAEAKVASADDDIPF